MLRDYQLELKHEITTLLLQGSRAVLGVLPTGAGKTVIMADILREFPGASCAIAHRQELVGQISMAMARAGVVHKIIAPQGIINWIISEHVRDLGKSFYNATSNRAVAGVDTLIKRKDSLQNWLRQVQLWEIDEAHHVLEANKWGVATSLFPNARGIGWTATPLRADRKPLRLGKGGVFEHMVVGPTMRDLIKRGFLTDYKIYGPPESIDLHEVKVTASGDFNPTQLRAASHKSKIVGDIVEHYQKLASGKLGVTFVVDVETAREVADAFNAAGVRAAVITSDTPAPDRARLIGEFRDRKIMQLVNVDIFGEGFDLPAIEVVSMARPTQSYGLYVQQFGRGLRLLPGKSHGIIIDHVGNVRRHNVPDKPRSWSLDAPIKKEREKSGEEHIKICTACWQPFEPWKRSCPHCGHAEDTAKREKPEYVEGDLTLYTDELLETLHKDADKIMQPLKVKPGADIKSRRIAERWNDRIRAQHHLRNVIASWAGVRRDRDQLEDAESYRLFYRKFGVDVLSAKSLSGPDADDLTRRIIEDMWDYRREEAA